VSAQQARERKKQYVTSLEDTISQQKDHIGILERRLKDLEAQAEALRNIIKSMRGFELAPAAAAAPGGCSSTGRRVRRSRRARCAARRYDYCS
jgi:hypothetical protein